MWKFWRWPRPPMDPLVAVALLVRGCDRDTPEWTQIIITKRRDHPDGGVTMQVR